MCETACDEPMKQELHLPGCSFCRCCGCAHRKILTGETEFFKKQTFRENMEPSLVDEIDCGNLFDQIDDLIEFPPESECGGGGVGNFDSGGDCNDYPSMWIDALPESDPFFSKASDLSAGLSVPYEDIVQLEWLSAFVEDSFSGEGMTIGKESSCIKEKSHDQFQPSSPVSGLESSSSSSSCSGGKTSLSLSSSHSGAQRARSKRPRPPTFNPRVAIQLISPSPEAPSQLKKAPRPAGAEQKTMKKKIKITQGDSNEEIRKCKHCEITKTPQWRAGPMGPKSLCNACGVRYKSGRLFPQYRPAASPTFVPSLHSNSHKKVVEMRIKATATPTTAA